MNTHNAPQGPFCDDVTSSPEPEVHNASQCYYRMIEPATGSIHNVSWSSAIWFPKHASRQTDNSSQFYAPFSGGGGGHNNNCLVLWPRSTVTSQINSSPLLQCHTWATVCHQPTLSTSLKLLLLLLAAVWRHAEDIWLCINDQVITTTTGGNNDAGNMTRCNNVLISICLWQWRWWGDWRSLCIMPGNGNIILFVHTFIKYWSVSKILSLTNRLSSDLVVLILRGVSLLKHGYSAFKQQSAICKNRNAWQSLAYSPLGVVVSPPSEYVWNIPNHWSSMCLTASRSNERSWTQRGKIVDAK